MFNLKIEINGEQAKLSFHASALAAVQELHSMAREFSAQQEPEQAKKLRKHCDIMFGTPSQQDKRAKVMAASLRGKKPSKTWPNGLAGQPVEGLIGDLSFSITPSEVVAVAEAEAITAEAVAA